ncbi:hypothetical protein WJX72_007973 [[Myrmecia] bisecta]|uniref:RCC1-like domain-containing protein n=1 Tax=[Myrmecia] bisecta TaxID=41462 RepID=A0AAW1NYQ0_9CHLO
MKALTRHAVGSAARCTSQPGGPGISPLSAPWRLLHGHATAVLSFGSGSQGALGCKEAGDNYEPEHVELPQDVISLAAGHYHSLAVTASGQLWTWGRNREQQLGRVVEQAVDHGFSASPGLVEGPEGTHVNAAAASGVASFAIDSNGCVWAWGASKRGQLGLGPGRRQAPKPERLPGLEGVVQLECGWGHAVALTDDGKLWSWGFPQHSRLGHSAATSLQEDSETAVLQRCVWAPQRVALLDHVKVEQEVHSREQAHRQAGPDDWRVRNETGTVLQMTSVAAGLGHCLGVTADQGDVFSWGWNSGQQLGLGPLVTQHVVPWPTQIYGLPHNPAARLAAGRVHSILVTDDVLSGGDDDMAEHGTTLTQLYSWGSGLNGRLGLGTQKDSPVPELLAELDGAEIYDVACGHDHTLVLIRL